jgi:molybdopterin/thiamine biosynthesis adenylyltransferase
VALARKDAIVAVVGLGGLGCPAALALARAGVGTLRLLDDDLVDRTNLHRQILYREEDVGRHKLEAAADALRREAPEIRIDARKTRLRPDTVGELAGADVILECSDQFAVKFLTADAAFLQGTAVVIGAAIRWIGTALSVGPRGGPCYRCLFEDIPGGGQASCDISGVVGPVCGVIGGLQAQLALDAIDAPSVNHPAAGHGRLLRFDGLRDSLRAHTLTRRPTCPLCGVSRIITSVDGSRYLPPDCGI